MVPPQVFRRRGTKNPKVIPINRDTSGSSVYYNTQPIACQADILFSIKINYVRADPVKLLHEAYTNSIEKPSGKAKVGSSFTLFRTK